MTTSRRYLLDSCVLIALGDINHVDHARCRHWFHAKLLFATCPITQGALIRHHLRHTQGASAASARLLVERMMDLPNHEFWPDDVSYLAMPTKGVIRHRQVTDAYLVALAVKHKGTLATIDESLAAVHPGVLLIPRLP